MNEKEAADILEQNENLSVLSDEERAALQEKVEAITDQKLPTLITISDPRSDVLGMVSRSCNIPPSEEDILAAEFTADLIKEIGDNAVAIAAPQIGIPRRFFVMRLKDGNPKAFYNPVIRTMSTELSNKLEGCLSVPGGFARIRRPRTVQLEYVDATGELHVEEFSGIQARAVCHEVDHLNGLIIMEQITLQAEKAVRISNLKKREKAKRTAKRRAKNKMARQANRRNMR